MLHALQGYTAQGGLTLRATKSQREERDNLLTAAAEVPPNGHVKTTLTLTTQALPDHPKLLWTINYATRPQLWSLRPCNHG